MRMSGMGLYLPGNDVQIVVPRVDVLRHAGLDLALVLRCSVTGQLTRRLEERRRRKDVRFACQK